MIKWQKELRGNETVFQLTGAITEHAAFDALAAEIQPPAVVLDLGAIDRINSLGVRDWLRLVRALEAKGVDITLDRVSVPIMYNLISISGFEGNGRIRSVFVPYLCRSCDEESQRLVSIVPGQSLDLGAAFPCPRCRTPMELNDVPELYDWLSQPDQRFAR